MTLAPKTKLGQYEIIAAIGAGAMGEVYRARDTRLNRDVAVKVLPAALAGDAMRLKRFELEVQSAGGLNHSNILAIYDAGVHEGSPYLVSELLTGETLRQRLAHGRLGAQKAIEIAQQVASGLAAAHTRGIVHRDIKPDNLFLTRDGVTKILDFGLAKLVEQESDQDREATRTLATQPGAVVGTISYMAPEQIEGGPIDARADIFSLGCVLYEMLSGNRPFTGRTSVETMRSVLRNEPAEINGISPALDRLLRHCLEKKPEDRFQSARDLAFNLAALAHGSQSGLMTRPIVVKRQAQGAPVLPWVLAVVAAGAAALAGYGVGKWVHAPVQAQYKRLTYRRGRIESARFGPDGNVLYSAAWERSAPAVFSVGLQSPESHPAGFEQAILLAVSQNHELALEMDPHVSPGSFVPEGLLATAAVGAAPRPILDRVQFADWAPDGHELAVVRNTGNGSVLEYPIGTRLAETTGYFSEPRISRDGKLVAFLEHPVGNDAAGHVSVVDRSGHKRMLTGRFDDAQGLAWSALGNEIWFTAARTGLRHDLWAVTLDSRERLVLRQGSNMLLEDVSLQGRALIEDLDQRQRILFRAPGLEWERDLTWLDFGLASDISPDGRQIAFSETGEGAGDTPLAFIRPTDGGPAENLGEGLLPVLSPDLTMAVAVAPERHGILIYPVGPGKGRKIDLEAYQIERAGWLGRNGRLWFLGSTATSGRRFFILPSDGSGEPVPVTPEGSVFAGVGSTPDGRSIVAAVNGRIGLYPAGGGRVTEVAGIEAGERMLAWSADGRTVLVYRRGELPIHVFRVNRRSGSREPVMTIDPPDHAGLEQSPSLLMTPDARAYAYTVEQELGELHLVDGLR